MTDKNFKNAATELPKTWASRLIFFILCAGVALTALLFGTVHAPTIALFWASAAFLVMLWAADGLWSGALRFSGSSLQLSLIGAILFGLIQIIPLGYTQVAGVSIVRTLSYDSYQTQLAVWHFAALLVFFAAALAFIDSPQRFRFLVFFITVFGFAFAFFAIIQNLLDPGRIYGIWERPYVQPFGSFVNKHDFAAYIEMCVAVPLGLLFAGAVEREKRLLYLTAVALMGIALVLSGSRGGLIALLAELIFLGFVTTKTRTTRDIALKILLVAVLFGAIVIGTILIGTDSTLTRIAETANTIDPTSNRLQIWATTLEIIRNNFLFGVGWGAFPVVYTQFDLLNGRERIEQAHNDYLQILADAGIIGAVLGASFLFFLFRDGWRRMQSADVFRRGACMGALAGCFAVLVHSFFDFVLHITAVSLLFLILAAVAVVNGRVEKSEKPKRRRASVTPIDFKRKQIDDKRTIA
jgi:O-antigen ligase